MVGVAALQFDDHSTLLRTLTSNKRDLMLVFLILCLHQFLYINPPPDITHCFSGDLGTSYLGDPILLHLKCHKGF